MKTYKKSKAVVSRNNIISFFLLIIVFIVLTVLSTTTSRTVSSFVMTTTGTATDGVAATVTAATAATSLDDDLEDSINLKRWSDRWSENNLGWHRDYIHPALKVHLDKILNPTLSTTTTMTSSGGSTDQETCQEQQQQEEALSFSYRVFVPLCGKSLDMAYLASLDNISQVVGLDGIEKALLEFVKENPQFEINMEQNNNDSNNNNNIAMTSSQEATAASSSYKYFNGKKIQLLKGDFFALNAAAVTSVGRFDIIYDRASMVAIEPVLRQDYVATIGRLIQPGGKILLIVIERDDNTGPPFSVTRDHVEQLYGEQEWVESITALQGGRDADDRFVEGIYLIQAKK